MAAIEHAHQMHRYGAGPVFRVVVPDSAHRPDVAGVVDQNVNCPVVSQGLGDGLLHLLTAGHVRDDGNCVAAKPPGNQIRRLL